MLAHYETEMGIVCDRKRCTGSATHVVTWHVMDHCTEDEFSNRIFLLCAPCAKDTVDRYREKYMRMKDALRQRNSHLALECTTCGKRVRRLSDVCRMERLRLRQQGVGIHA